MLWIILTLALELGRDEIEIASWPLRRLKQWWTYFQLKSDLEREAVEKAKKQAANNRTRR